MTGKNRRRQRTRSYPVFKRGDVHLDLHRFASAQVLFALRNDPIKHFRCHPKKHLRKNLNYQRRIDFVELKDQKGRREDVNDIVWCKVFYRHHVKGHGTLRTAGRRRATFQIVPRLLPIQVAH
jgi:hypothetical protein